MKGFRRFLWIGLFLFVLLPSCTCNIQLFDPATLLTQEDGALQKIVELQEPLPDQKQDCTLTLSETKLTFVSQKASQKVEKSLVLTNKGFGNCVLTNAKIQQSLSIFVLKTVFPEDGLLLPSQGTLPLSVEYTPSGSSAVELGLLSFQSNDYYHYFVHIPLEGSSKIECLEAFPTPLDFGSVQLACSSPIRKIEIYNSCTNASYVTIQKVALDSKTNAKNKEFFLQKVPKLPITLSVGKTMTLEMTFEPKELGKKEGNLLVGTSLEGEPNLVVALKGEGVPSDDQTDEFKQGTNAELDILFVIDNSGSMASDQASVSSNLNKFLNWTNTLQVDYHIGVTTTDITKEKGCLVGNSSPKYITSSTVKGLEILQNTVIVGTKGSSNERPLQASEMALSSANLSGCNSGFYRQKAGLSIIYITDEPDRSPGTVDYYIHLLKSKKGTNNPNQLRVSAIGASSASFCQNGGTTTKCRLYDVTQALRGAYGNIFDNNWGTTLSSLGSLTFGLQSQFYLSRPADPSTIVVKVNNQIVPESSTAGWSFDLSSNSISFVNNAIPKAEAQISIQYQVHCLSTTSP